MFRGQDQLFALLYFNRFPTCTERELKKTQNKNTQKNNEQTIKPPTCIKNLNGVTATENLATSQFSMGLSYKMSGRTVMKKVTCTHLLAVVCKSANNIYHFLLLGEVTSEASVVLQNNLPFAMALTGPTAILFLT